MALYNIKPHRKGDTFDGIEFSLIVNDNPLDLTGVIIRMDIRDKNQVLFKRLDNDTNGGISTKLPETDGVFYLDKQIIDIPANSYIFDIQFNFPNGDIRTYIWGNWNIIQDVTYDIS